MVYISLICFTCLLLVLTVINCIIFYYYNLLYFLLFKFLLIVAYLIKIYLKFDHSILLNKITVYLFLSFSHGMLIVIGTGQGVFLGSSPSKVCFCFLNPKMFEIIFNKPGKTVIEFQ